jgi:hypothetical protein
MASVIMYLLIIRNYSVPKFLQVKKARSFWCGLSLNKLKSFCWRKMSMVERYYQIAGMVLKISGPKGEMADSYPQLRPFRIEESPHRWEYHFRIVDELPKPPEHGGLVESGRRVYMTPEGFHNYLGGVEQSAEDGYMFLLRKDGVTEVQVKRSEIPDTITQRIVLRAFELEHLVAIHNGLLLHASCIDHEGKAVLFTAPSGIGKSTQAGLWEKLSGASIINGDRIIVRKEDGRFYARGVPFSGTSGICHQACLPISAIVCLQQAPLTTIRPITGIPAFRRIWEGCTVQHWDQTDTENSVSCLLDLISQVPIYELSCTPDESAVIALKNAMKGEWNH